MVRMGKQVYRRSICSTHCMHTIEHLATRRYTIIINYNRYNIISYIIVYSIVLHTYSSITCKRTLYEEIRNWLTAEVSLFVTNHYMSSNAHTRTHRALYRDTATTTHTACVCARVCAYTIHVYCTLYLWHGATCNSHTDVRMTVCGMCTRYTCHWLLDEGSNQAQTQCFKHACTIKSDVNSILNTTHNSKMKLLSNVSCKATPPKGFLLVTQKECVKRGI